jgi:hypothetical protein
MLSRFSSRLGPAALALLALALPASAAPAPPKQAPAKFEKYLLDDTDFLLTFNVKELAKSPLFVKHYRKKLQDSLGEGTPRLLTKDLGIDPLKDVDTVTVLVGRSCYGTDAKQDGPVFLLRGRFDRAKILAGLDKIDGKAWAYKEPGGPIYKLQFARPGPSLFVAVLDAHTIILSPRKQHVLDALAKAAGKKTTRFAHKEVPARLKQLRPDVAVQAFGLGSMVLNSSTTTVSQNGQTVTKTAHHTLLDTGVRELELRIAVKDDIQVRLLLTAKDNDQLKVLSESSRKGLDSMKEFAKAQAGGQPKFAAVARLLDNISLRAADGAVILESKITAEMIQALFEFTGAMRMP